ncbi:MAG: DUF3488 and DUF4129 domain-containing transglutaminase family protein, partial [Chloroflexota bacterium]
YVIGWQLGAPLDAALTWPERMLGLLRRLGLILYQLINRQTVLDSLLFVVLMCLLFWVLAVYGGFALARHGDAWRAAVPAGLALFVIQFYDPLVARRTWYLAFYIFFMLLLVARMAFVQQHARWKTTRTSLPPHLSLDFIRFAMLFAAVIVILAWTAPAMANALPAAARLWRPVKDSWDSAMEDFNYAFASLRSSQPVYSPVYGSSAVLGTGVQLSDTQIFVARAPTDPPPGARFYWRARTFDEYQDGQWFSNIDTNYSYDPNSPDLPLAPGVGRWRAEFEITSAVHMGTLFTPPQPLWVDRAGQVQYARDPDGTLDIASFISSPAVAPGEIYHVGSSLSAPTIQQMRQAGQQYPEHITARYLQLPETITPRTRQLAEQITAGLETPYEKVLAVTRYLRQNMTYVQQIEAQKPEGQEAVDWFLFDLKQGFCNYYSTAEIVLLRAVGIPARWSVGYAQGELLTDDTLRNNDRLSYLVRQKDAHAWPEVYFPGIGWVEFEPTAAQPDILRLETDRLDSTTPLIDPNPRDEQGDLPLDERAGYAGAPGQAEQNRVNVVYSIAAVLAGLILLALAVLRLLPRFGYPAAPVLLERALQRSGLQPPEVVRRLARKANQAPPPARLKPLPVILETILLKLGLRPPQFIRVWSRQAQLPPIARAYSEINRSLQRVGQPPAAHDTPAERAHSLGSQVPAALQPAQQLVREYEIATFSRLPADLEIARQSAQVLRRLSLRAAAERWLARFQAPKDRNLQPRRRGG